jgi:hypothetical protein
MPATSEIILSATTHPGDSTVETVVGEKYKGDGYYGRSDGLHTVQINVTGVAGTVKMQGTLATTPVDADWFDIDGALYDSTIAGKEGAFIYNFTGNFVWVRAYVTYTDGTINSILLNH